MTRKYEIVYIFDSALEEAQINEVLDTLHDLLKTPESPNPVTATSHWGKRSMAYEINGKAIGYYVVARIDTRPDALTEFERRLKLEDQVLRHLIVVDEGFKPLPTPADDADPEIPELETAAAGAEEDE